MNDTNKDKMLGEDILNRTVLHKRRRTKILEEQNKTLLKKLAIYEKQLEPAPEPKSNSYFAEGKRPQKKKEVVVPVKVHEQ